jgi:hypothetical protein
MSPLELRLKYKLDTGYYPLFNDRVKDAAYYYRHHHDSNSYCSIYSDRMWPVLRNIYIYWLEETFGTSKWFRDLYFKEFNNSPIKINYYCNKKINDYLYQQYGQWLEEYIFHNF